MNLKKASFILIFSTFLVSAGLAQQQSSDNETISGENVVDVVTPGDTFYAFKRFRERISLAVARAPVIGSPAEEARVLSRNAEERLREARVLLERNDTERAQKALQRYSDSVGMAINRAESSSDNETKDLIIQRARGNQEVLREASQNTSEQAQEAIRNAIENSASSNSIEDLLTGKTGSQEDSLLDSPSLPPGPPGSESFGELGEDSLEQDRDEDSGDNSSEIGPPGPGS